MDRRIGIRNGKNTMIVWRSRAVKLDPIPVFLFDNFAAGKAFDAIADEFGARKCGVGHDTEPGLDFDFWTGQVSVGARYLTTPGQRIIDSLKHLGIALANANILNNPILQVLYRRNIKMLSPEAIEVIRISQDVPVRLIRFKFTPIIQRRRMPKVMEDSNTSQDAYSFSYFIHL
jgi:hypothetical protein